LAASLYSDAHANIAILSHRGVPRPVDKSYLLLIRSRSGNKSKNHIDVMCKARLRDFEVSR